ncbi:unnamed protein product [Alopecurus aequalis]
MAPGGSKAEQKAALDAGAWMFNVVTSVGIIMVNKALMATHGFSFATTLTGLHFATTTLMTLVMKWLGYVQPSHLPLSELVKFVFFANLSIVGMNVSLMWNSVGFYQIAKLSIIPLLCIMEVLFENFRYSRDTKLSIVVVLLGVGVCTVSDVSVNGQGLVAAIVAVCGTALQQHYVNYLQRKYSLNSLKLLGHTAPAQAASLLILGPFVDFWLTRNRIDTFHYTSTVTVFLHCAVMRDCSRNQSQPVHLHWEIHGRHVSSDRSHEDYSRANPGIPVLWERRPELPRRGRDGPRRGRDDMVQQRVFETRRQGAAGCTQREGSEVVVITVRAGR